MSIISSLLRSRDDELVGASPVSGQIYRKPSTGGNRRVASVLAAGLDVAVRIAPMWNSGGVARSLAEANGVSTAKPKRRHYSTQSC
jgi:hypothetical protein